MILNKSALTFFLLVSLAACGGGSGTGLVSDAPATPVTSIVIADDALALVPSPNSAASVELVAVQSVANALQALVAAAYPGAEAAALGRSILAIDISKELVDDNGDKLLVDAYTSFMRANCLDKNGTLEVTLPQAVIDASKLATKLRIDGGTQSANTYKNCKSNASDGRGNLFYEYRTGNSTVNFRRYQSETDYAYTVAFSGLSSERIQNGVSVQKILFGANSCDTLMPITCFFSNDGLRGWGPTTYLNGVANGSFATLFNGGVIKVTFASYDSVSGSASIEGANGTRATIFRQSANKFSASITPKDGVSVSFTFTAKI